MHQGEEYANVRELAELVDWFNSDLGIKVSLILASQFRSTNASYGK